MVRLPFTKDAQFVAPTCPYCGMEMVEDLFYEPKFYCVNPDCEVYKKESEEGDG